MKTGAANCFFLWSRVALLFGSILRKSCRIILLCNSEVDTIEILLFDLTELSSLLDGYRATTRNAANTRHGHVVYNLMSSSIKVSTLHLSRRLLAE